MATNPQQERREEVRHAVLDYLAARPLAAQSAGTIHRRISREFDGLTLPEVEAALIFLADLGHVRIEPDQLGATKYFQVTAQGQLAQERGA